MRVEEADTTIQPDHYIFIDDLRLVRPYFFDFKCNVKKRWEGKSLLEMFSEEFPLLTTEYYTRAIKAGRLRVESSNGKTVLGGRSDGTTPPDMVLASGSMCVRHLVHRHEPPVLGHPVQVITVTKDWVAVVKPPCMPVHTVGQYRKNTVLGVLEADRPDLGQLYCTNRLDKPVSGLLVLARSAAAAGRMRKSLEERTCSKVYVAKVQGRFPATLQELQSAPQGGDQHVKAVQQTDSTTYVPLTNPQVQDSHHHCDAEQASTTSEQQVGINAHADTKMEDHEGQVHEAAEKVDEAAGNLLIQVDAPLAWSPKSNHATAVTVGSQVPSELQLPGDGDAREAATVFRLLKVFTDPDTGTECSLVECRPLTGRTHQIRVHLQYLGFPIANDTQYGGTMGKPLAFRRLREAVAEQQQRKQQQQQAQQVGASLHKGQDEVTEQDGSKGCRDGQKMKGDEPLAKRLKGEHTYSEHQRALTETGSKPRAAHVQGHNPSTRSQQHTQQSTQQGDDVAGHDGAQEHSSDLFNGKAALLHQAVSQGEAGSQLSEELQLLYRDPRFKVPAEQEEQVCPHCPCLVPQGYPIDLQPLWLHALRYKCSEWCFEAPLPDWASCTAA